jgi:hypothetical protein
MYKIKILKDTPFDKANAELTIQNFRLKYNYLCTNNTTDIQLINYLRQEYAIYAQNAYFQVIEIVELHLPLCFVYEDLWYVKEMDGMYHVYTTPITKEINTFVKIISQPEARQIISNSKYKNNVLVCTNFVNRQMK